MDIADALRKARQIFVERGGAVGIDYDPTTGKVCAIGALLAAYGIYATVRIPDVVMSEYSEAANLLHEAARELYNQASIASVNDLVSPEAALHCYDHAIKRCE